MRPHLAVVLLIALIITGATYMVSPIISVTGEAERGWPLGWAITVSMYEDIPFFGPLLSFATTTFNYIFFILDVAFWFTIVFVITSIAGKRLDE